MTGPFDGRAAEGSVERFAALHAGEEEIDEFEVEDEDEAETLGA